MAKRTERLKELGINLDFSKLVILYNKMIEWIFLWLFDSEVLR